MQPVHRRPFSEDPACEIWIGPSSWDPATPAVKFAWKTQAGSWARGGEQPLRALIDEVALALDTAALTWDDFLSPLLRGCTPEETVARVGPLLSAVSRHMSRRATPTGYANDRA